MTRRLIPLRLFQRCCAGSGRKIAVEAVLRTVSWRESVNGLCQGTTSQLAEKPPKGRAAARPGLKAGEDFKGLNRHDRSRGLTQNIHSLRCGLEECRPLRWLRSTPVRFPASGDFIHAVVVSLGRAKLVHFFLLITFLSSFCSAATPKTKSHSPESFVSHFLQFDLDAAAKQADSVLARDPHNVSALFVRMEVAELQAQTSTMLDSALRLCRVHAPAGVQEIASNRIFRNAANSKAFTDVLPRVTTAAQQENGCSLNLKLALVAAAGDGAAGINLDQAAASAGLLTRWHISGPFGRYSNAEFENEWKPESQARTEEFLFRDGIVVLPDYLSSAGVLYASGDIQTATAQNFLLDLLSPGPYAVFIDGMPVLTHDSRYALQSGRESATVKLRPGKHRISIKFTADAAPLRVALYPQTKSVSASEPLLAGPLRLLAEALQAYFREDQFKLESVQRLTSGKTAQYLKALLYSESEAHAAEERAAWELLVPAPLARIKLAEAAMDRGAVDDLKQHIAALPDSEITRQLAFQALGSEGPLQRLLAVHPSCSHLSQALSFYNTAGRPDDGRKIEDRLATCAPESLEYARVHSASGNHAIAVESLQKVLAANPLHRAARRMMVQELLLDNREKEAQEQARKLHEIAPGSPAYARLAVAPYEVLDSKSSRAAGFAQQSEFYLPYRRDGLKMIRNSAERQFSGGPFVTLLFDKIAWLDQSGALSVYIHRITRVLNKDGIMRMGEAAIPRGADPLELRTIKANGQIIEPELTQQKPTISMPALEPGDSIEEEFVTHDSDWNETAEDAGKFVFGSFTAPILYSRFVVIAPEAAQLQIDQPKEMAARVEHSAGEQIYIWQQDNITQTAAENYLPSDDLLPTVSVTPAEDTQARQRDELIESTRIGLEVMEVANKFRQSEGILHEQKSLSSEQQGLKPTSIKCISAQLKLCPDTNRLPIVAPAAWTEYDLAKRLYRFVTTKISASSDWNTTTAEDTLLNFDGSRTAALLAISHALGLKTELVLARQTDRLCRKTSGLNCYTEPLVRFRFADGKTLDVDAETSGAPFGALPSTLDTKDALLAPLTADDETRPIHTALMPSAGNEKSVAEGDLRLENNGNLSADIHVTLGTTRAQAVRQILRNASQREQQMFYDQLAMRIFPGAVNVSGSAVHEDDPEQPLELTLHCTVSQLLNVSQNGSVDVDQLVPALGLRALYAKNSTRKFPLYIDSVFFESTIFHLHLPSGLQALALPSEFAARNEFGEYSARFSSTPQQINIQREFRIPVQVVPAEKYEAFARFARQIDEAERRRISLTVITSRSRKAGEGSL